jgi:hypothetical protein
MNYRWLLARDNEGAIRSSSWRCGPNGYRAATECPTDLAQLIAEGRARKISLLIQLKSLGPESHFVRAPHCINAGPPVVGVPRAQSKPVQLLEHSNWGPSFQYPKPRGLTGFRLQAGSWR